MDIIRMSGGIGNQMFQYALYLKLVSLGKEVKFDDVTEYKLDNARPVMLWVFGIDYPKASREEVIAWTDAALDLGSRVRRKLLGRKSREYHEKSADYDEEVLRKEDAYLCGCFQSERYFKDVEGKVRDAFRFRRMEIPEGMEEQVREYERLIAGTESVSIHIRRGITWRRHRYMEVFARMPIMTGQLPIYRKDIRRPVFLYLPMMRNGQRDGAEKWK